MRSEKLAFTLSITLGALRKLCESMSAPPCAANSPSFLEKYSDLEPRKPYIACFTSPTRKRFSPPTREIMRSCTGFTS